MSVVDLDVVDMIATKPGSDEVRLVIADQLTWEGPHSHKLALQEKINAYIAFIETNQIWSLKQEALPENPRFIIAIARAHKPPDEADEFFGAVSDFLRNLGIELEFMVSPSYCDA